jgi:hypothetical protein
MSRTLPNRLLHGFHCYRFAPRLFEHTLELMHIGHDWTHDDFPVILDDKIKGKILTFFPQSYFIARGCPGYRQV